MSKRGGSGKFKTRPLDFFPTPLKAIPALRPFLARDNVKRFAEPWDGEGDLVGHLQALGLTCKYRGDIRSGKNALTRSSYGAIDGIITNPPHTWNLLRPLLVHFPSIAPTWLLLTSDLTINLYAASYLNHCSDIAAIGRLKWVAGTKQSGFENFVWCRVDARHRGDTVFHNKRGIDAGASQIELPWPHDAEAAE